MHNNVWGINYMEFTMANRNNNKRKAIKNIREETARQILKEMDEMYEKNIKEAKEWFENPESELTDDELQARFNHRYALIKKKWLGVKK